MTESVSRRELLKKAGLGGALIVGGSVIGHTIQHRAAAAEGEGESYNPAAIGRSSMHESGAPALYGHAHSPPPGLGAAALDVHTFPPPPDGKPPGVTREIEIVAEERLLEIGADTFFEAWTYNGTVPGPILRATEGDALRVHFENRTGHAHNIHFHGSHRPEQDGWEPVAPGGSATYEIVAGPAGLHPYHCHTAPFAEHIGRGLYGMLIVDPPRGRPPALEVALMLSGFSNEEIGRNGIVAWNGVAGFYDQFPIKVPVGESVRAYLVNMIEDEPVGSFHLHAETFDVYPAGMGAGPAFRDDTITLGQAQRAIVEFSLPHLGRYMFHPHQHWLADRGAMGWFAAV
jgi:FtsP/CotA-like multicopper oxidase with cupredoxin domain